MTGPKITIVGGGSYSWGPLFVRDLLIAPALQEAEIVLHDVDVLALETMYSLGQTMIRRLGRGHVERTPDLEAALRDADFVILTITTGGLEAMRHDVEIPEKYGVFQAVGDTVGPGGLVRALRNIPVVAALAQKMDELCPRAWLLNYTNPMTTLCRTVSKTSSIRTIGLCHEWHGVRDRLSAYFGVPASAFAPRIAGINHLPWLLGLAVNGEDYMPRLQEFAAEVLAARGSGGSAFDDDPRSTIDRGLVKSRLLQLYGALPVAGDRHVAEFFPFFLTEAAGRGKAWGIDRTPIVERYAWRAEARQRIDWLAADGAALDKFLARPSGEAAGEIITALATGGHYAGIMNLPNHGQIAALPAEVVVETLGVIEQGAARGLPVGTVPLAVEAILRRHISNQELAVEAALTGSRTLALQALLGDPLCPPDIAAAERMLEEMLAANGSYRLVTGLSSNDPTAEGRRSGNRAL
jgi:alpha-galactosidase/6-phospho-beta-glucosidase family protein